MRRITDLTAAENVNDDYLLEVVDIDDSTMAETGTNKRVTAQVLANSLSPILTNRVELHADTSSEDAVRITQTGSGNIVYVSDEGADASPFVITSSGNVGVGTSTPEEKLHVDGNVKANLFSGPLIGDVSGNSTTATTLQTARTISISGEASGSASFNGGEDVSIALTVSNSVIAPSNLTTGAPRWNVGGNFAIGTTDLNEARVNIFNDAATAALLISQTGTGPALVIRDQTADSTPFVIDTAGRVVSGHTAAVPVMIDGTSVSAKYQQHGIELDDKTLSVSSWSTTSGADLLLARAKGSQIGNYTVLGVNDSLGNIRFYAADGVQLRESAKISSAVDDNPNPGASVPGRLVFSTAAKNESEATERMRISGAGNVGIGTASPVARLHINDSTLNDAIRITQSGNGNAVRIEDGSPDTTPIVIDKDGRIVIGYSLPISIDENSSRLQLVSTSNASDINLLRYSEDTHAPKLVFAKARTATIGDNGKINSGDSTGSLSFYGNDGFSFVKSAEISSQVDASSSTGKVPGRLVFSTHDSNGVANERMRIDSAGRVGIAASSPQAMLDVRGDTKLGNRLDIGLAGSQDCSINIGVGVTANRSSYTNYIGDTNYSTYGLQVGRTAGGANGNSVVTHRGTGLLNINAQDAGSIVLSTSNSARMTIDSAGLVGIGKTADSGIALDINGTIRATAFVGVTQAMVGLGNVTNESKATMFTNPAFTGTPTAPTAESTTNTTQIATTEFVQTIAAPLATRNNPVFTGTMTMPDGVLTSAMIANGTLVDADVSSVANIAKTKISGTAITAADIGTVTSTMIANGTIVDADVSESAAIAGTKIAPNFGSQNISTSGSISAGLGCIISGSGSTAALRITQNGLGDALVVEDSTTDTSPFVIDNSGRILIGTSTNNDNCNLQIYGNFVDEPQLSLTSIASSTVGATIVYASKPVGTTVVNNSVLGTLLWKSWDGSVFRNSASISSIADSGATSGSVPARLIFSTSGSTANPVERMRIDSSGNVGIGKKADSSIKLDVDGTIRATAFVGVTQAMVGLGNVTNESKATMFTNPAFTGTPIAPTANTGTNTTQIATTAFVQTATAPLATRNNPVFTGTMTMPDGVLTSAMIANGTLVDADINSTANIAKTKISGTAITAADIGTVTSTMIANGTIVDADVNSSAAIAGTKIAPNFGTQSISTTGTLSAGAGSVIAGSSLIDPALRITQSGSANALVVQDETNDSSPFVIDSNGNVIVGYSQKVGGIRYGKTTTVDTTGDFQHVVTGGNSTEDSGIQIAKFSTNTNSQAYAANIALCRSHSTVKGTHAAVQDGQILGSIYGAGSDGIKFTTAASIGFYSDGLTSSGSSCVPGEIRFSTRSVGNTLGVTTHMRIDSSGNVGIGKKADSSIKLDVDGTIQATAFVGVTQSMVGLGNVTNESKATMFTNPAFTGTPTAPTAVSTTNTTQIATTAFVQTAVGTRQATITGAATTITSSNLTTNRALIANSDGKVAVSDITSTELGYLDGVTSNIQTQLNGKQSNITGAATSITGSNLTTNRVLISNDTGKVASSSITTAELNCLSGANSNIQSAINGINQKLNSVWTLKSGALDMRSTYDLRGWVYWDRWPSGNDWIYQINYKHYQVGNVVETNNAAFRDAHKLLEPGHFIPFYIQSYLYPGIYEIIENNPYQETLRFKVPNTGLPSGWASANRLTNVVSGLATPSSGIIADPWNRFVIMHSSIAGDVRGAGFLDNTSDGMLCFINLTPGFELPGTERHRLRIQSHYGQFTTNTYFTGLLPSNNRQLDYFGGTTARNRNNPYWFDGLAYANANSDDRFSFRSATIPIGLGTAARYTHFEIEYLMF